jgi:hypothetical protein
MNTPTDKQRTMEQARNRKTLSLGSGTVLLGTVTALLLTACGKEEKPAPGSTAPVNEEELITTVKAVFVGSGSDTAVFQWEDLDGAGGSAPIITGDTLLPSATYTAHLLLLNASASPIDTTSLEVLAEATQHQFFFSTTGGALAWTGYGDADANGRPLGLITMWATTASGQGSLRIILRHQPNKDGAGVSAGDITNAGGETDIEVAIPYAVQ